MALRCGGEWPGCGPRCGPGGRQRAEPQGDPSISGTARAVCLSSCTHPRSWRGFSRPGTRRSWGVTPAGLLDTPAPGAMLTGLPAHTAAGDSPEPPGHLCSFSRTVTIVSAPLPLTHSWKEDFGGYTERKTNNTFPGTFQRPSHSQCGHHLSHL